MRISVKIGAASRGSSHFFLSIKCDATHAIFVVGERRQAMTEAFFPPLIGGIRSCQRSRIFGALHSPPDWRVFESAAYVKKHVF